MTSQPSAYSDLSSPVTAIGHVGGTPARQLTEPTREVAALALLAGNAVFLLVALAQLIVVIDGWASGFGQRSAAVFASFVGPVPLALPMAALLLATHVAPMVVRSRFVVITVLAEYGVSAVFGTVTFLGAFAHELGSARTTVEGLLVRGVWLGLLVVACVIVVRMWLGLYPPPKPAPYAGYPPPTYGRPYPGQPLYPHTATYPERRGDTTAGLPAPTTAVPATPVTPVPVPTVPGPGPMVRPSSPTARVTPGAGPNRPALATPNAGPTQNPPVPAPSVPAPSVPAPSVPGQPVPVQPVPLQPGAAQQSAGGEGWAESDWPAVPPPPMPAPLGLESDHTMRIAPPDPASGHSDDVSRTYPGGAESGAGSPAGPGVYDGGGTQIVPLPIDNEATQIVKGPALNGSAHVPRPDSGGTAKA